jgi:hypothetical protein
MYITAAVLLGGAVLEIVVIKMGFGMNGAAIAAASMFLIASLTANSLALLLLKDNAQQIWSSFGRIYLPFIYSFAGLMAVTLIHLSAQPLVNSALKSLIYFLYCIPIFVYTERKIGIISRVFNAANSFRKKKRKRSNGELE